MHNHCIYHKYYIKNQYNISSVLFRAQRKMQCAGFVTRANQQYYFFAYLGVGLFVSQSQ